MTETATELTARDEPVVPAKRQDSKGSAVWREIKGLLWVLLAVLLFHSFVAKPFYIPSESMMPVLLKGDRLVVTKYPYGWSFVSPTIPNPAAIFRSVVLRTGEGWGVTLPFSKGRLLGKLPKRGDIVIVTPPGANEDYIKRVIGLPGDTIEVRGGRLILNGKPVQAQRRPNALIPVDVNISCADKFGPEFETVGSDGKQYCSLPIVRETLPGGPTYDTVDLGPSVGDDFPPTVVPADRVFLMGDNRDSSADSRFPLEQQGLGGPVPWENIGGRAEFITFSLDGTTSLLNPASWFSSFRSGRAGNSLRGSAE